MKDAATQRRLLAESKLTLAKALEIAQGMEAAAKQPQQLTSEISTPVDSIKFQNRRHVERKNQRYEQTRCWRCNGQNHRASECRFRTEKCRKCDGVGHIARACRDHRSSQQTDQQRREAPINNRRQNVRYVREDNVSDNDKQEDDMPFGMYMMQSANIDSRILVPVMLNGDTKINFELDTGASVLVVSEETWKHDLNSIQLIQNSGIKLTTYTGELLNVIGKVDIEVSYEGQNARVPLHV